MTSPLFIALWFVASVPSSFMAVSDSDVRSSWGFRLLYSLLFSLSLSPRLSVSRSLLLVSRCLLFFLPVSSVVSTFSFSFAVLVSFPSLLLSLTGSPISLPLQPHFRSSLLSFLFLSAIFFLFFLRSVVSFGYSYLFLFLFSCLFSFSSVTGCFPLVVSLCRLWLGLRLCLCSSHPFSSFSFLLFLLSLRRTGYRGLRLRLWGEVRTVRFHGMFSL